jgi:DNA polymerase-3 subunit beta
MFSGMLVECEPDNVRFVAIDGFIMAIRNEAIVSGTRMRCVVPSRTMSELLKILAIQEESTLIQLHNNRFIVNVGTTQITSNLVKGNFINYSTIPPSEINTLVKTSTNDFLNGVSRASLMSDSNNVSLIRVEIEEDVMRLTSRSDYGKVVEEVSITKSGANMKTAFNAKYLTEILKNVEDDRIVLELKNSDSPTVIKPVDSDKFLYLIMPVRYS